MGKINKTGSAIAYCEVHGKLLYTDRKTARGVSRQHATHKNVYRCDQSPGWWHIGGLPVEVRRGNATKDEFYSRNAA